MKLYAVLPSFMDYKSLAILGLNSSGHIAARITSPASHLG